MTRNRGRYSTPLSLTSQFPFCGLPLRLDSYAGCAFQCSYCFARYRGGNTSGESIRSANSTSIHRTIRRAMNDGHGLIAQFLRRRVPIHFGGMSDPFQPIEAKERVSEDILKTLVSEEYPTVISTKSALVASPDYISLLREARVLVQFSFSSSRDDVSARVEPLAHPPSRVLQAMEQLSVAGIPVSVRWQPFIPGVSENAYEFARRVARAGARHVGFEHLKLPVERGHRLWSILRDGIGGDPLQRYHKQGAYRDGREFILPAREKLPALLEARDAVRANGMTFGAADNDLQYLSDTSCCCSGADTLPGFENWFRFQIGYAVRKCRGRLITFESIQNEWRPSGPVDRYINSRSRLSMRDGSIGSIDDHIRFKWNNPQSAGSPISFFGVRPCERPPESGDLTYEWSTDVTRLCPNW
jgi:DNA repair photolyase